MRHVLLDRTVIVLLGGLLVAVGVGALDAKHDLSSWATFAAITVPMSLICLIAFREPFGRRRPR